MQHILTTSGDIFSEEKKFKFFDGARHILLNSIGQESMLRNLKCL